MSRMIDQLRWSDDYSADLFFRDHADVQPVVFDVQNVASYFYTLNDQEYWDWYEDFPNVAPPTKDMWFEFDPPKWIESGEHGRNRNSFGATSVGMFVHARPLGEIVAAVRDYGREFILDQFPPPLPDVIDRFLSSSGDYDTLIDTATSNDPDDAPFRWVLEFSPYWGNQHDDYFGPIITAFLSVDADGKPIDLTDGDESGLPMNLRDDAANPSFLKQGFKNKQKADRCSLDEYRSLLPMIKNGRIDQRRELFCKGLLNNFITFTHVVGLSLTFMHAKVDGEPVERTTHEPSDDVREQQIENHGTAGLTYHKLVIDPIKTMIQQKQQSTDSDAETAYHLCRGHFKHYTDENPLFGKHTGTFWCPPHFRGDPDEGRIKKEYDVKGAQG